MPKLSKNAQEQNNEGISVKVQDVLGTVTLTTSPVVIAGVSRRVGLANYEHLDLYLGVALPLEGVSVQDIEELKATIATAAELGFQMVSKETGERYKLLKEAQSS